VGSAQASGREQDHVVAKAGGHLKALKPNHCGARKWRNGSGHPETRWKIVSKHARPLPGTPTVGVLTSGVAPMSEFICVLPLPDGDAR